MKFECLPVGSPPVGMADRKFEKITICWQEAACLTAVREDRSQKQFFGQFSGNFQLRTSDFKPFVSKLIETNPEDSGAMELQSLLRTGFGGFNL